MPVPPLFVVSRSGTLMRVRLTVHRSALVTQAMVALLVGIIAVIVAFLPHCAGISAFPGTPGGRDCDTFLLRGGPILISAGVIAVVVAAIDLTAALRPRSSLGWAVLIAQLPIALAAAIAGGNWFINRARAGIVYAVLAIAISTIIVIASPRWTRSTATSRSRPGDGNESA